jgi:hypothetical protein
MSQSRRFSANRLAGRYALIAGAAMAFIASVTETVGETDRPPSPY